VPDVAIAFDRAICGDLAAGTRREWIVTNGIGGFASGTISGVPTRRYHGLLFAALHPPLDRTLLVASLDEIAVYDGVQYPFATIRWHDGTIAPEGYRNLESFELEGTVPRWTFACADALVDKRVWMEQDENTTYAVYDVVRAARPLTLCVDAMVSYRPFHATMHPGEQPMSIEPLAGGIRVVAHVGAVPFSVRSDRAACEPSNLWYYRYDLAEERARGLDDVEDRLRAATFAVTLREGERVAFVASVDEAPIDPAAALQRRRERDRSLLEACGSVPPWIARLALAADQFLVRRSSNGRPGRSVIAGYHWFGDWSRDAAIAIPGLALATGRPALCAEVLETFRARLDRGMLPNFFPDAGEEPQFNSVDAPLWFVEAVRQHVESTGDRTFLERMQPALLEIVRNYRDGTRYGIRCDPADGLLYAGEEGVQLTWMDAKVGDEVITPRIGKAVEINALWYNALHTVAEIDRLLGATGAEFDATIAAAAAGFERFWNEPLGYCYDVLDAPNGNDPSLRPNQIFAVCLPRSPLSPERQRGVVDVCGRTLLATNGLRSLAATDPRFHPCYGGGPADRDAAYHQGTVWTWLAGPYAVAHYRVYRDRDAALAILRDAALQTRGYGVGTLAEVADGTAPFRQRGCIAQAWSVAEVLRAYHLVTSQ
jgi:predicted glycogen debranching enzyme